MQGAKGPHLDNQSWISRGRLGERLISFIGPQPEMVVEYCQVVTRSQTNVVRNRQYRLRGCPFCIRYKRVVTQPIIPKDLAEIGADTEAGAPHDKSLRSLEGGSILCHHN